ncbi:response regulator [Caballeronia sp. LZ016]|uniref:response regulator n=1 Tax=Caballeronia sp. LZ016 TaxID=3038554 RepID=UPI002860A7AE|nr:response regulator [Caballeronia sp. LZ016]MDR5737931.1 response regulator [Caballeronia sp. LZ016]
MNNRAYETSSSQSALWNRKRLRMAADSRRVLVALTERALGESLVSLFDLKGFPSQYAADASSLKRSIGEWRPHAVFVDTRIGGCGNYALVRDLRNSHDDDADRLIIAMSGFLPEEPLAHLREAGYDGHCRRPCPVWQMTDILDDFFASHLVR